MKAITDYERRSQTQQALEESQYLVGRAEALRRLLREAIGLPLGHKFVPEFPDDIEIGLKLAKLADFYLREMDRCLNAVSFLGANIMGISALEALLLMACLRERTKVCATKRWQSFQRKRNPKPFLTLLSKRHIADLLFIGRELNWFADGSVPLRFKNALSALAGRAVVDQLSAASNAALSIVDFATAASTGVRNLLHPGRWAQSQVSEVPTIQSPEELVDYLAMIGTISALLALACFLDAQPTEHLKAVGVT